MADYYGNNDWRDYLAHYGVKGMKWRKHKYKDKIGDIYEYASGKLGEGGNAINDWYNTRITGKTYLRRAVRADRRMGVAGKRKKGDGNLSPHYRVHALGNIRDKALSDYNNKSLAGKIRKKLTGKSVRKVGRGIAERVGETKYSAGGEISYGSVAKRKKQLKGKVSEAVKLAQAKNRKSSGFTTLGYVGDRTDHMKDFLNYKKGNADKAKSSRTKKRKR